MSVPISVHTTNPDENRPKDEQGPLKAGLYVHVPFCSGKCIYCDFYSVVSPSKAGDWLDGVTLEAGRSGSEDLRFDTLYIGGGTPSRLTGTELRRLFEILGRFPVESGAEVTIEANPEDVTSDWIRSAMDLGINRFSLGVQSFDSRDLEFMKRRHDGRTARQAIERLRAAGVTNLSLDLIFGLPHQDASRWQHNLVLAAEYQTEHLSCYQLTVEPGTGLDRLVRQNRIVLPDEEAMAALFLQTHHELHQLEYIHYEISNFAMGPDLKSRHNLKYWLRAPYIGLGPSAHSFFQGVRWWNERSLKGYLKALNEGRPAWSGQERLSEDQARLERVYLGLRHQEGVLLEDISETPGARDTLARLLDRNWARIQNGRLVLEAEGLVRADRLAVDLCDD